MKRILEIIEKANPELKFKTSRAGGPGGQNVNKIESKVTLKWNIESSSVLSEIEKNILLDKLSTMISTKGYLVMYHQTERSQIENKEKLINKWEKLISKALKKEKPRKPTVPTKASLEKRKKEKSTKSIIKELRKKPKL